MSGRRVIATVVAGPSPGQDTDTPLVFVGDGGPPFRRRVNARFAEARLSVGSQYLWWVGTDWAGGPEPVATIYGPADPIGTIDDTSVDDGWQPVARVAGEVRHIGGRDAGHDHASRGRRDRRNAQSLRARVPHRRRSGSQALGTPP